MDRFHTSINHPFFLFLPCYIGVKHSGFGSTLGLDGIRNFLRPRAWHLRKGTPIDTTNPFNKSNVNSPITYDAVNKSSIPKEKVEQQREAAHPQPGPIRTKLT